MPFRALIYCIKQPLISVVALLSSLLELDQVHPNAIERPRSYILRHTPANELVKLCFDTHFTILPRR
jgi:hypothetical protein